MEPQLKVFTGRANQPLAQKISRHLELPLGDADMTNFADGEIRIKINENVRGSDVFVIQSTQPPADNLLELLLIIDALKRASAERVTAVIPYYGYARQDRKAEPRVPVSAKLVANLLVRSGADRILTMELHAEQIQGFFDIPVDHLYSTPIFIEHFPKGKTQNLVVVAPDPGRANRARGFARRLGSNIPIAIVDKRRPAPNQAEAVNVVGEVTGLDALIFDDMIDTASTLVAAASVLAKQGAKSISAVATHGILSGPAVNRIASSEIKEVIITDTINLAPKRKNEKIKVLSVSPLLAEAILRIHRGESVSSLFV
ncbi:phosphoribosylpyrophosphate synthetase [candidate division WOR-3 bacterium JGI_Cruoil_03_51_56]|uniref:Ribose-phosphate pyrophosphokinase n=1 Tax=candidate division WOR-3 bacterium JGI_Cruoil_03_51_56 TaxID=1973747 RepID=A0A235BQP2_UNCW3|nr:MAG: phosphoribosylpyrophosphate synthetase [candidate division WOR-3 bacterium JGI_Cruoil_03_51_56]